MSLKYPAAKRVEQVDIYHGVKVEDPYRWMEDLDDPELKQWRASQLELTKSVLESIPSRSNFLSRIDHLSRLGRVSAPLKRAGRWFQSRTAAGADLESIYVSDSPLEKGEVALAASALPDGQLLNDFSPSPDGTLLLYATSQGGSDWRRWFVMEVGGGIIDDSVRESKLWAQWLPDSRGFLYQRFPSVGVGARKETSMPQLFRHRVGDSATNDELIYEDRDNPHYFFPRVTSDGRYLVITTILSPADYAIFAEVGSWDFQPLASSSSQMWFLDSLGDEFIFTTTHDAEFGRVVAVRPDSPDPVTWRTVVPEKRGWSIMPFSTHLSSESVIVVRDYLGRSEIAVSDAGGSVRVVDLPDACRVVGQPIHEMGSAFVAVESFLFAITTPSSPSTLMSVNLGSGETRTVWEPEDQPQVSFAAEVVWSRSEDGTQVPMTLVRATGVSKPTVIMEGYGGGGDSAHPYDFQPWKVAWLESGGAIGSAHLRGGRELGIKWQMAAARAGKLKAMQDFIGCGEYLSTNLTEASRIAITGRSSGAMLAAAAAIARSDLFAVCLLEVGMFDPLRYHLFGLGRLMVNEYGTSEVEEDFRAMYDYSPLHRVIEGTDYPAMLITVHTDDDRVLPGSAYKFAATVQRAQSSDAPILLYEREGAGHFLGTTEGEAAERADILAFAAKLLATE